MNLVADNPCFVGQSIERYVEQAETSKQPIEATSPQLFTERKEGVKPETNIRTDRWEIAQDAMDKVAKSYTARREEWIKQATEATKTDNKPMAEA